MKKSIFFCLLVSIFIQYNLTAQCGTTVNTGVCYNSDDGLQVIAVDICPDSPSDVVTISFTAGSSESCCDEIVVYEGATGSGTTGTEIFNQSRGATDLGGLNVTGATAGECLHIYINADGSVDCTSQGGVPASFDISCSVPPPSGGETCATSTPLCAGDGTIFDGTGGEIDVEDSEPDIDLGCITLGSGRRPSWFYIQISATGNINMALNPEPEGSVDYDFALYGPFADLATATSSCGAGLGAPIDCSFAGGTNPETPSIANAVIGEVYLILVSKFSSATANFTLSQTGGTGETACLMPSCDASNGTFGISGSNN